MISNFSHKSFKNYSSPPNFFKSKNIIFGHNGRGKSSLSEGIIRSYQTGGGENTSFRFFNGKYVKEHLLLSDNDSIIRGVKVSFSENDIDITRQIKELETKIVDTTVLNVECKKDRGLLREQIDALHSAKKGKAKINRKKIDIEIEKVISQYENDLKEALKINPSKEFIKNFYANDEELESNRIKLINTPLPNLNIIKINQNDQTFLIEALEKQYTLVDDIPTTEVIKWLDDGIDLHEDSDSTCKFCHSPFTLQDVKERILEYRENSQQKDIVRLVQIKETLKSNKKIIEDAQKIKKSLTTIGLTLKEIDKLFDFKYLKVLDDTIEIINDKISNMSSSVLFDNHIADFENEVDNIGTKIAEIKENKLRELDLLISNIEKLAKGAIAIAIEESQISEKLQEIQEKEKHKEKVEAENKRIKEQIKNLEESKSEYKEFMEFLNEILSSLDIQIKLSLENENYYLKHTLEDVSLSIDSISEGEKNLLALLYFYFELYKDKEQNNLQDTIKLIVIDDPVSSLDEANKFYVLEIMKKLLSEKNVQVFILTHSWDDFCHMSYGIKTDSETYGLFEIYKNASKNFQSEIRICQHNITPYKKLFLEIYQLQSKSVEELDECNIYHAANSMRRIFEEFLNFKKPNLLPQKSSQNEIQEIYRNVTGEDLGNNRKRKLGSLLTFINVLSHRPIKSEEVITNSKTLMRLIEDIDKVHFDEMKKNQ